MGVGGQAFRPHHALRRTRKAKGHASIHARTHPQAYFNEVNKRRAEVNKEVSEKFNLSKGGKQDPAIKWMELRKQGKIKDREKYEQYGETNRGIVIPQAPFGMAKYDQGERYVQARNQLSGV